MERLTSKQLDAAVAKGLEMQKGVGDAKYSNLAQIRDIWISFEDAHAPGPLYGRNAVQISGVCENCGMELTRTLAGAEMQLLSAFGSLLQMSEEAEAAPIRRKGLCPCGSGKKYKHCCGREQ